MTKEEILADIQDGIKTWDKSVIKDVPVFYMYHIYERPPEKEFSIEDFDEEKDSNSRVIVGNYYQWDKASIIFFKNGVTALKEAFCVEKVLKHFFLSDTLSSLAFLCVPASTQNRQEKRYKLLSKYVCSRCNMANGYEHVFVKYICGSKTTFGKKDFNVDANFDENWFKGKKVVLLDYIIYSGDSIRSLTNKLEKMGATVIGAIILTKFVHEKKDSSPYYAMDRSVKPTPSSHAQNL